MASVLYCDNHLLALDKPAGLLTQPNETSDPSLEAIGKAWVKETFHKPGAVFLHAVHRLDRPVSGIVLFARTSKALARLNETQRQGLFQKKYIALVNGHMPQDGILEHFLVKEAFHARPADAGEEDSKKCLLKFHLLKHVGGNSLLEITLITGRYHQIRAQLAASGHPIVGDSKYGGSAGPTLLLHHSELTFPHPITHEPIHLQAPVPF